MEGGLLRDPAHSRKEARVSASRCSLVRSDSSFSCTSDLHFPVSKDAACRLCAADPSRVGAARGPRDLPGPDWMLLLFCAASAEQAQDPVIFCWWRFHCEARDWGFLLCWPFERSSAQQDSANVLFSYKSGGIFFFFLP